MLTLQNITRDYKLDSNSYVHALRGIDLEFKQNEFVSILGPSGCGKTTLLNIIGGLDKYTTGDLFINGTSTNKYTDSDWDAYRNSTIGFVFQNYNLIPHLNVFDNVAISLALGGISGQERKERTLAALEKVGLSDQVNKRPNQLSGGQMQRVAIARALINNPKILLADEPTGALDSKTSVQIMQLIKEISKDHLVIMVTHNQQLAEQYSDRMIHMLDGKIINDSRPVKQDTGVSGKFTNHKTSMSMWTALKLSFKNLLTKKTRTIITSIAGSVGIIGVALVLAISSGMTTYVNSMQSDTLAGFPITISKTSVTMTMSAGDNPFAGGNDTFPDEEVIYSYDSSKNTSRVHYNNISDEYISYLKAMDSSWYNSISFSRGLQMNVITQTSSGAYKKIPTSQSGGESFFGGSSNFNELPASQEFVLSQYDLLGINSKYPSNANEAVLIIDKNNRLDVSVLDELGISINDSYSFNDMLGKQYKVISNNDYYKYNNSIYIEGNDYGQMYNSTDSITLTIVGIMRVKEEATSEIMSTGIGYTVALTDQVLLNAKSSSVAIAQSTSKTINVLTGEAFNSTVTYNSVMQQLGASDTPTGVQIYPKNFDSKEKIKTYLNGYNKNLSEDDKVLYMDLAETITSAISTVISTISIILIAFAAISLVVSTIMIAIITYVSVVERTKEIGILRAVGARKKDVSRVFTAETLIIGFIAGLIGVVITYLLSIPINMIVASLVGVSGIASLPILYAVLLIALSMVLTLIAGFVPSRLAAKKDPVVALRTE